MPPGERLATVDRVAAAASLVACRLVEVEVPLLDRRQPVVAHARCGTPPARGRARPRGQRLAWFDDAVGQPDPLASAPSTPRPVSIRSIARLWPIRRGRLIVPRSTRGTPKRRQNTPSTASAAATRRSHHSASSSPPATAGPSMAAITGFDRRRRVGPIGPGPSSDDRAAIAVRQRLEVGAGAEVPPAPVSTATDSESSASKALNASSSAAAATESTALRRSGRSMVTTRTGPSSSTSHSPPSVDSPPVCHAAHSRTDRGQTARNMQRLTVRRAATKCSSTRCGACVARRSWPSRSASRRR